MKNRSFRETLRCHSHIPFGTPSGFYTLVHVFMCNLSFKKKHGTVFIMEIIHFCLNHSFNRYTSEFQICNCSCYKLFNPYTCTCINIFSIFCSFSTKTKEPNFQVYFI